MNSHSSHMEDPKELLCLGCGKQLSKNFLTGLISFVRVRFSVKSTTQERFGFTWPCNTSNPKRVKRGKDKE